MIRDPLNGAWCDNLYFPDVEELEELTPCGEDNNFYSSAGEKCFSASKSIFVESSLITLILKRNGNGSCEWGGRCWTWNPDSRGGGGQGEGLEIIKEPQCFLGRFDNLWKPSSPRGRERQPMASFSTLPPGSLSSTLAWLLIGKTLLHLIPGKWMWSASTQPSTQQFWLI